MGKNINKNILISTGPTRVYLDPIRYITNISSGLMGLAFIEEFLSRNSKVRAVSGVVNFDYPKHENLDVFYVETNNEMLEKLDSNFDWADVFISIAAVVDFEPTVFSNHKIKKTNDNFSIEFKKSVDILNTLSVKKRNNQILIGFALETEGLIENAKNKLISKNLDFIVANEAKDSMGLDSASVSLISKSGDITKILFKSKRYVASEIIDLIFGL